MAAAGWKKRLVRYPFSERILPLSQPGIRMLELVPMHATGASQMPSAPSDAFLF